MKALKPAPKQPFVIYHFNIIFDVVKIDLLIGLGVAKHNEHLLVREISF